MKKLLVLALVALLTASTAAYAADAPASSSAAASGGNAKSFEQKKARALANLQKHEACVQAASDMNALKACYPRRGNGHWHRHGDNSGAPASTTAPSNGQ